MRKIFLFVISISLLWFVSSCSGGSINPIEAHQTVSIPLFDNALPVGVSEYFPDGSPSGGMGILGLFNLHLDSVNLQAELTPVRSASLTDVLEVVDITNFLTIAPCTNCVKIKSVDLYEDLYPMVKIGIKHPFPVGDPLKPITGRNRADLHVFNVEGIVVSSMQGSPFYSLNENIAYFKLLSADGYTAYLDDMLEPIFPTWATIHPYITHFDDYGSGNFLPDNPMGFGSVTDPPPSGNLVMAMGSDYWDKDYIFDIPVSPINFIFAVGCTYAVSSASKSERFNPEYRIPQHNKKAASKVSFEILSNDLKGEDESSTAQIEVRVVDVSHGVAVGDGLDQMLAESNVGTISIEVPFVMADVLVIDGNTPVSGTGHDPSDQLVYRGTITNTLGMSEGTYFGLIKVTDTYPPGLNGSPLLSGMDGIQRVGPTENPLTGLFQIPEFATYQVFEIDVMTGNEAPIAILTSNPDPAVIFAGQTIDLNGTASYDNDGSIILYEFDFNLTGTNDFNPPDASNTTGLATSFPYTTAGQYEIGLRVTDNEGAFGYDSINLTVEEGCIIYVDDDNTTPPWLGTLNDPYQYVQDGVDAVTVSDCIVWIKPGRYNEDLGGDPWTSDDAEVTIANLTNLTLHGEGRPVINCHRFYGPPWPSGIRADNCPGIKIEGIDISLNYHNQGYIRLTNCSDAVIDNCKGYPSTDQPSGGAHAFLWASGCPNLVMKNCVYENTTNSSTSSYHLGMLNSCNNALITLNKATNNANATNIYQTFTCWLYVGSSSNVEISKNILGNHHKTASAQNYQDLRGIYITGGSGNKIRNNLIYDLYFHNSNTSAESRNWAIWVVNSPNVQIYHNTIDSFGPDNPVGPGYTYGVYLDSNCLNSILHSNIVSNIHANGTSSSYGFYSAAIATSEYTDVWNITGLNVYRYSGSITEGTGCLNVNPLFENPSVGNYHLQTGSQCRGAGKDGYDMGCYGGPDPLP